MMALPSMHRDIPSYYHGNASKEMRQLAEASNVNAMKALKKLDRIVEESKFFVFPRNLKAKVPKYLYQKPKVKKAQTKRNRTQHIKRNRQKPNPTKTRKPETATRKRKHQRTDARYSRIWRGSNASDRGSRRRCRESRPNTSRITGLDSSRQ